MPDFHDAIWLEQTYVMLAVGLTIGLIAAEALRRVVRTRQRESNAAALGLRYQQKGGIGGEKFSELPLFRKARSGRVRNLACNGDLLVFDFSYQPVSDASGVTRQTVAVHRLAGEPLTAFALRPEGIVSKGDQWLGASDVDFDDDPAFSKRYQLMGTDEDAVRELFAGSIREELTNEPGWSIEGRGQWIVLYRRGQLLGAGELGSFVARTRALVQALVR